MSSEREWIEPTELDRHQSWRECSDCGRLYVVDLGEAVTLCPGCDDVDGTFVVGCRMDVHEFEAEKVRDGFADRCRHCREYKSKVMYERAKSAREMTRHGAPGDALKMLSKVVLYLIEEIRDG
ncbi:MAG: hypothetical protein ABEN55_00290 [Bradymonadaceae bacterium]